MEAVCYVLVEEENMIFYIFDGTMKKDDEKNGNVLGMNLWMVQKISIVAILPIEWHIEVASTYTHIL